MGELTGLCRRPWSGGDSLEEALEDVVGCGQRRGAVGARLCRAAVLSPLFTSRFSGGVTRRKQAGVVFISGNIWGNHSILLVLLPAGNAWSGARIPFFS